MPGGVAEMTGDDLMYGNGYECGLEDRFFGTEALMLVCDYTGVKFDLFFR